MAPVIELREVSKFYGKGRTRPALDQVSLQIPAGVTGLLGPNGSGKSTMIKGLLGLLRFDAGQASVLGYSLPSQLQNIRDQVGYLPEDDCYLSGLSGIEVAQFMARLSGLPAQEGLRRAHEILDFSDMGGERYRGVESYSTGMRQKLKFANALVHDPRLLILDEPTTGLDPQQRAAMLRRIRSLAMKHGKSVLLSTHILHDVKSVCDQVIILSKGKVRVVGTLDDLSRPVEPGMSVQVTEGQERFVAALESHQLGTQRRPDGTLWVMGVNEETAPRLWRIANEAQVSIVQMVPAKNSLEQVFMDAVKETDHAIA